MIYPRIILCVFLIFTVSQANASDCAVGYAHLKNGKYEQAYKEFRTLAERGYSVYMNVVADMHRKGQGVPASNKLAHVWYSLSAAQGNDKGISGKSQMSEQLNQQQLTDSSDIAKEYAKEYLEPYVAKWSLD